MAGKADLVNSIVDSVDGIAAGNAADELAYASLDAAEAAGADAGRGGWVADG
ncbi:MAG TPA: hypothetical protein VEQ60_17595 [Longimicrobium sp.]|nr:hypothetical protein [Longimicrobium sp.]